MSRRAAALGALLLTFSVYGSVAPAGPPVAEFIPSGDGAFSINVEDVISVDIGDALGTILYNTLSIAVVPAKADKWQEMTRRNIRGTATVKICGTIVSEDVVIQTEMLGPIFVLIYSKEVEWATAVLLGKASCELIG